MHLYIGIYITYILQTWFSKVGKLLFSCKKWTQFLFSCLYQNFISINKSLNELKELTKDFLQIHFLTGRFYILEEYKSPNFHELIFSSTYVCIDKKTKNFTGYVACPKKYVSPNESTSITPNRIRAKVYKKLKVDQNNYYNAKIPKGGFCTVIANFSFQNGVNPLSAIWLFWDFYEFLKYVNNLYNKISKSNLRLCWF